ncbi:MAG TPA: hypothetical protein VKE74_25490 [Gemmataceae bacterium]|nr:hypothetical protein [Gemmataceae bacterium]
MVRIALRHELFSQIKADRRLIEMGSNKFSRRCERYGVGRPGGQAERPHGKWALILDDGFVADLVTTCGCGSHFQHSGADSPCSPWRCSGLQVSARGDGAMLVVGGRFECRGKQ